MTKRFFIFLVTLFLIACFCSCQYASDAPITIDLSKYEVIQPRENDSVLLVTLLHAYKVSDNQHKEGIVHADLLVCREPDDRDSILVLDLNELSDEDMFNKKSQNQGFVLNLEDPKQKSVRKVVVEVPPNFKIPNNIKFAVGRVNVLID